jgi:DNA-binding transcriptional MerR regulator
VRIGQLAAQTGYSVRTIRFYEQSGLLPAPQRTPAGYRCYDQDAVTRLRFVRSAQALGLTLGEIGEVLRIREDQGRDRIAKAESVAAWCFEAAVDAWVRPLAASAAPAHVLDLARNGRSCHGPADCRRGVRGLRLRSRTRGSSGTRSAPCALIPSAVR